MSDWDEPHIRQAADSLDLIVRRPLIDGGNVHAATYLVCSAWMAGTILYRLEVDGRVNVKPGTVVLSEEVNVRLPECFNLIAVMAARGDSGDEAIESLEAGSCDERLLTMQQARDTFEPVYWAFARRQGLTAAELVLAATLSTAVAAANCRPAMGLKATTHLAHYSMLEASKTAPGPRPTIAEGKAHLHKLAAILPPLTWSRRFALWLKP
ncbi:MAG: hypothetical protein U1C04_14925 [Hydrogenophaga sp.]|uniref:hypothetical protein n=1 Tax=Hydrogenophaga sp. TaxID=1904254 RepID=UPI002AB93145|nr:hypothetical protein [Hydrogenophaga sp.]MDZ4282048.1 hypothetical protein [Hydrogenophaga sp.]